MSTHGEHWYKVMYLLNRWLCGAQVGSLRWSENPHFNASWYVVCFVEVDM